MMIPDALHPMGRKSWRTTPPTPPLPYDAEVDYLESTGTQWIDTGIKLSSECVWTISAAQLITDAARTFGINVSGQQARFNSRVGNTYLAQVGNGSNLNVAGSSLDTLRHTFVVDAPNRRCHYDDKMSATSGTIPWTGTYNLPLFAARTASATTPIKLRIYSSKIVRAGTTEQELVPVRVGSGASAVGYLYDKANPTGGPSGNGLYGNSGTGAFTIGPDKN